MKIYPATDENILRGAALIKSGGVVSFPTETVYGLGADAFNPAAAARIFEIKNRPYFDPLIVHIAYLSQLEILSGDIDPMVWKLAGKFWPGPLTLVIKKLDSVPDIITAGLDTIACRMPGHPVALRLIKEAGTPIAAPSANPFGYLSPTKAEHVLDSLGDRVDMILDGGECPVGIESTIISLVNGRSLLRPGGIPLEEIEKITGKIIRPGPEISIPLAPGQFLSHYSPSTPVRIEKKINFTEDGAGYLLFHQPEGYYPGERTEILTKTGDLKEAAANLFSSMHRLDRLQLKVIIAEPVEEAGLGLAIMDRLKRASKKKQG